MLTLWERFRARRAQKKREAGIQPGIRKGDRKRRLQGFEVLLAKADAKTGDASGTAAPDDNNNKSDDPNVAAAISAHLGREAARDKRPRGGLAPSLVALLWEHQLPAALAAGVAAAALASEKEAASSSVSMMSRFREGAAAGGGGGESGGGEEGPASAAAALVFAGVRQVALRLLRGAGDPLSGALVFAGQPRSTAALAYGLDPCALATPVGPEGSPTIEALADGLDQVWCWGRGGVRARVRAAPQARQPLTPFPCCTHNKVVLFALYGCRRIGVGHRRRVSTSAHVSTKPELRQRRDVHLERLGKGTGLQDEL